MTRKRDPRKRLCGGTTYSMGHMLPWTDPQSNWMAGGRRLEIVHAGPGCRWGLKPRRAA